MIESYKFGSMKVKGTNYTSDLKIIKEKVVGNWWRRSGHVVDTLDVQDILGSDIEVLVVGKGSPGMMCVSESLRKELERRGIKLIEKPTAKAYPVFNQLLREGKKVAGAFHLTC